MRVTGVKKAGRKRGKIGVGRLGRERRRGRRWRGEGGRNPG